MVALQPCRAECRLDATRRFPAFSNELRIWSDFLRGCSEIDAKKRVYGGRDGPHDGGPYRPGRRNAKAPEPSLHGTWPWYLSARIPDPTLGETPRDETFESAHPPFITRIHCGGRNLTLVKTVPPEILPLVTRTLASLKRPYLHYGRRAA
jgi:hypothetical protein